MKRPKYSWELAEAEVEPQIEAARAMLATMATSGIGMTCGACGHFDDLSRFVSTPVYGDLPVNQFQCPACKHAFRRQSRQGWIELQPVGAML
jgi:hypothetical protein